MFTRPIYQVGQAVEGEARSCLNDIWERVRGGCHARRRLEEPARQQIAEMRPVEHIGQCRRVGAVIVLTLAAAVGSALAWVYQGRRRGEWGELGMLPAWEVDSG